MRSACRRGLNYARFSQETCPPLTPTSSASRPSWDSCRRRLSMLECRALSTGTGATTTLESLLFFGQIGRVKTLVTGGAGFIGSHACLELLAVGHEVVVLDNLSNSSEESLRRV